MLKKILKVRVQSAPVHKLLLVQAFNEKCFWVHNGPVLSNLKELFRALKTMSEAQFSHHVNRAQNDFALWVEGVLQDNECAKAIRKSKTVEDTIKVVEKRLKDYAA